MDHALSDYSEIRGCPLVGNARFTGCERMDLMTATSGRLTANDETVLVTALMN